MNSSCFLNFTISDQINYINKYNTASVNCVINYIFLRY